jgi:hypothetical protein
MCFNLYNDVTVAGKGESLLWLLNLQRKVGCYLLYTYDITKLLKVKSDIGFVSFVTSSFAPTSLLLCVCM